MNFKRIIAGVFAACICLTSSVYINNTKTTMPVSAYSTETLSYNDTNSGAVIKYLNHGSSIELVGCTFGGEELVLPSEIDGLPVTTIGWFAFSQYCNNTNIKSVVLPEKLKVICSSAFYDQKELESITIPDSVEIIDGLAFAGCTALEKVVLPKNLRAIEGTTFARCTSLKEINIPDGVQYIDYNAFLGDTSLVSVDIPKSVKYIGSEAFKDCSVLESVTFSEGLESIGESAFFWCRKLKSAILPSTLKSIGDKAFNGCTELADVTIQENTTEFGDSVFGGTKWASNVAAENENSLIIVNNVLIGGSNDINGDLVIPEGVKCITKNAFYNLHPTNKVSLPSTLEKIGDYAFSGSSIKEISIPDSVKYIGINAFYNTQLKSIKLPESLEYLGDDAFEGADFYDELENEDVIYIDNWLVSCNSEKITELVIKDGTVGIAGYAFKKPYGKEKALANVVFPDGFKYINDNAFEFCKNLEYINLPDSITDIGDKAFLASGLKEVVIPDSVVNMGTNVFERCTSLEYAKLSNSLSSVPKETFWMCEKLKKVDFPENVKRIERAAFLGCKALEPEFPATLEYIGDQAFESCYSIKNITIPENVKYIGDRAFSICKALTDVTILSKDCEIKGGCGTFGSAHNEQVVLYYDGMIYGYTDSTVQEYAQTYNLSFTAIDGVKYDVNNDGVFDVADVVMLQKWLAKSGEIVNWKAGDCNNDNKLNVFDLCIIKRKLLSK